MLNNAKAVWLALRSNPARFLIDVAFITSQKMV